MGSGYKMDSARVKPAVDAAGVEKKKRKLWLCVGKRVLECAADT